MLDIIYFTRKFPPVVGGMETLAGDIWDVLHERFAESSTLVANSRGNSAFLFWLPKALLQVRRELRRRRTRSILFGDVLLYLVSYPFLGRYRSSSAVVAHGTDVIWRPKLYQFLLKRWLPRVSVVVSISQATSVYLMRAGVSRESIWPIRLGVKAPVEAPQVCGRREELHRRIGLDSSRLIITTIGRLVPRKGVCWFLREVLPLLPDDCCYVVAGDGPDMGLAQELARGMSPQRVKLLGQVSDEMRNLLMSGASLFVQPNVSTPGDVEGFGLVVVEAALRGTAVVAADLEGLQDAIVNGSTGILIPSGDASCWVAELTKLHALGEEGLAEMGARLGRECASRYSMAQMGDSIEAMVQALTA